jgi:hypothetical protein
MAQPARQGEDFRTGGCTQGEGRRKQYRILRKPVTIGFVSRSARLTRLAST